MSTEKKLNCTTLGCRMAYAVKGIMRLMQQRFRQEGIKLTIEQFFMLNILDNMEGLILQELAEIVDRDKSAVLRHIDGLEENHYVARSKDPEDGRRKILLVTKKGMLMLEEAKMLEKEVNDELTRHIPSGKLREYEKNIDKIYDNAMEVIH